MSFKTKVEIFTVFINNISLNILDIDGESEVSNTKKIGDDQDLVSVVSLEDHLMCLKDNNRYG